jgi:hypothetical protein
MEANIAILGTLMPWDKIQTVKVKSTVVSTPDSSYLGGLSALNFQDGHFDFPDPCSAKGKTKYLKQHCPMSFSTPVSILLFVM